MKYIYAAMLLHTSGKKVDEESIKKVMASTGVVADEAMIKALVASLSEVNIDEAIKLAPSIATTSAQDVKTTPGKEEKKEEKKEEGEAIAGLGALFG